MKIRHFFSLMAILIILFSLSAVAAGENATDEVASYAVGDSQISIGENLDERLCESQNVGDNPSGDEAVDLAVWIDVNNVQIGKKYNQPGYEVPWNITVWVNGGTAHNVKVNVIFSNTLKYMSHNETAGKFNPDTCIWTIGDLSSSGNVTLSLMTKLQDGKKFKITAEATTDSNDTNIKNNVDTLQIKSGVSKFDANVSQTSSDVAQPKHGVYSNSVNGWIVFEEEEEEEEGGGDEPDNPPDNPPEDSPDNPPENPIDPVNPTPEPEGPGGGGDTNPAIKSTQSFVDMISQTLDSLGDLFTSDSNNNLSKDTIKAISAQNYAKIPIYIFALFLIILAVIVAYDKFKP